MTDPQRVTVLLRRLPEENEFDWWEKMRRDLQVGRRSPVVACKIYAFGHVRGAEEHEPFAIVSVPPVCVPDDAVHLPPAASLADREPVEAADGTWGAALPDGRVATWSLGVSSTSQARMARRVAAVLWWASRKAVAHG